MGLYLSDLTFNAERASIIKEHNHNLSGDGDGDGEGEGEGDTLINLLNLELRFILLNHYLNVLNGQVIINLIFNRIYYRNVFISKVWMK